VDDKTMIGAQVLPDGQLVDCHKQMWFREKWKIDWNDETFKVDYDEKLKIDPDNYDRFRISWGDTTIMCDVSGFDNKYITVKPEEYQDVAQKVWTGVLKDIEEERQYVVLNFLKRMRKNIEKI
jgi:hypothetical protein